MQRWEYTWLRFNREAEPDLAVMNRLGDQGWELVAAYPVAYAMGLTDHVWLLFKRPK